MDIAWTLALHMAGLIAFAAALRLAGRRVAWTPLVFAVGATTIYFAAEVFGFAAQSWIPLLAPLHWNWLGKVSAIVATLVLIAVIPGMTWSEVGLTLKQRKGSALPAVAVILLACAVSWIAQAMAHIGMNLKPERLLFQATMPGLDEELFWRGLLLALLTRAFGEGPEFAGARFGFAEIAVTLLFAAGHGLAVSHGAIAFDASACLVTGVLGAAFMWLRRRTDSLLAPVLAHNLCNFGNSFF